MIVISREYIRRPSTGTKKAMTSKVNRTKKYRYDQTAVVKKIKIVNGIIMTKAYLIEEYLDRTLLSNLVEKVRAPK